MAARVKNEIVTTGIEGSKTGHLKMSSSQNSYHEMQNWKSKLEN
jgi:hypothetical protein